MNETFAPRDAESRASADAVGHSDDQWRPILPVPADAPALSTDTTGRFAPTGFVFTAHWRYLDGEGRLLGYVVRYDRPANGQPADKQVKPFTFCEGPAGKREWRCKGFSEPRPLYGLDRLAVRPEAPVLVVEGEKTADAAEKIYKHFVVVTSPGGSNAADKVDWSHLKGRKVTIWPDNDESGEAYSGCVGRLAVDAGAQLVSVVQLPAQFPESWDLADPIPAGYSLDSLVELIKTARPTDTSGSDWPAHDGRYLHPGLPEPPTPPLDDVFLPAWVKWMRNAAEAKGAPTDYIVAATLTVCGSLIGNTRWSQPWSGWSEPPVLWAVTIGNPSAGKSPALDAVLTPLRKVERRLGEKARVELDDWNVRADLAKLAESEWKDSIRAALKAGEEPPPRPASASPGPAPVLPRLAVSDATVERVAVILAAQPRGLLLARDELAGWLESMKRYTSSSDQPFWLEAYGGRAYTVERINRESISVDRLSVGVIGGIQPDRIRNLILRTDNDGLLARLLPIWPNPVPAKRPGAQYDEAFIENVVHRLLSLDMPDDSEGRKLPSSIPFTEDAANLLVEFRQTVQMWEKGVEGLLLSFIGKLPGMAVRLSLILAFMDWASSEADQPSCIDTEHFGRAAHLIEAYLLPMARRSYADASISKEERSARELVALIRSRGWREFSSRDVQRSGHAGLTCAENINSALRILEDADLIRPITAASGPLGGRPIRRFGVNPAMFASAT
ncbi:DUF3987 domain-containing protein [Mesorhizobium sp. CA12]|nr:DUF3987 domain-containing protein [Mesorhizobium sp. CA12]